MTVDNYDWKQEPEPDPCKPDRDLRREAVVDASILADEIADQNRAVKTMFYKTFQGTDLAKLKGAYGNGEYDLTRLPIDMPLLNGTPQLCEWGYHVCHAEHLVCHLADVIAVVEPGNDLIYKEDKGASLSLRIVSIEERWTPQVAMLFACDCAARVLPIANDARSNNAVRVSRLHALGLATAEELEAARDAAGWAAVRDARAAAWAARAAVKAATRAVTWDAAWDATRAAGAAVEAAAEAVRDARAAAWVAVKAAWATARDAAWDAAWATVKAAAERAEQTRVLFCWLRGERTADDVMKIVRHVPQVTAL